MLVHKFIYQAHTHIGLWQIAETQAELRALYQPSAAETAELRAYKLDTRQMEWLASRLVVRALLPHADIVVSKDEYNKPFFSQEPNCTLSLSHGKGWAAAAINTDSKPVGIDIEVFSPKIMQIRLRFLTQNELSYLDEAAAKNGMGLETMVNFAWCAKEALYKMYGTKGLNFRQDMKIVAFYKQETTDFMYLNIELLQKTEVKVALLLYKNLPVAWCTP